MIVAGRDVCHERAEYIERCIVAKLLLELYIRRNLIKGHMPGALHHHLNAACPRTVYEFPERDELRDLTAVRRVCQTPRAHTVAQADRHIVFLAYI